MKKTTLLFKCALHILLVCIALAGSDAAAQVYLHNFGTTSISGNTYTVPPTTLAPGLSGSTWTNSTAGGWTNFAGAAGEALSLQNSSGTPVLTLTFNVTPGNQLDISSFSFWRQRSGSGAQNWTMAINGIAVGTGTVPTSGATTGQITVANPIIGLTGAVTVTMTLSGATGTGTFRLDDFRLNGTVTPTASCTAPAITSVTPTSGPANTIVTINGSGFEAGTGTSAVKFNGTDAAGFTVISDNVIKAIVPATGTTGAISVTTNGCAGNSSSFTVITSNCNTSITPTDIYISEVYDQRTGSGGMIELYNPTNATITFNNQYILQRYANITDPLPAPGYILTLTGSIAPGATYLVAANDPDPTICNAPPFDITYVSGFNANDKFELLKNNVVIDVVNVPFLDPGFTLIRKPAAIAPLPIYNALDWNNLAHDATVPNNYCANLGTHAADSVIPPATVAAQPTSITVCEDGTAAFTVVMTDLTGYTFQWKVLDDETNVWQNVTNDQNYSGANSNILTINDIPLEFLANQYYCVLVKNGCTLVSNAVQLTVSPLPIVLPIPTNPTCFISTGSVNVVPLVGIGLTYSLDGTNFQAGTSFGNLAPGNYTLSVRTFAGCQADYPFTIDDIPLLPSLPTIVLTQPTCTTATGSIEVTGPLGLDLLYSLNGIDFQAGTNFTSLAPGTYELTVRTLAGCESSIPVVINPAPLAPAVAVTTVTQPSCTTATGAIVITTPTGAGFTYSINGGVPQTGTTFAGLTAGTYTITTENADGCTSATAPITINAAPVAPTAPITAVSQPTCTTATGTITVTSPLGTGLTYSINDGAFQSQPVFTALIPGNYTLTVQNAEGCTSASGVITINPALSAPAVAITTVTQPTCTTATGLVVVTSANAGLTYSINGTDFQAATTFAGLAPGTYTVTTQNADGCTSVTAPITINPAPTAPAVATTTVTQPTCTSTTGTITVTSANAGLTYSINGTTFQSGTTFAGLAPGTYTITTQNAGGCTSVTSPITINTAPSAPITAVTTVTQPTCTTSTGTITVTSANAGFTYSINGTDFQSGTTFAGLAAGSYTITTQNADGCTSVTAPIIINPAIAPAVATTTVTQPTCSAISTGIIVVEAPTGTGFTYSIDGTNFQAGTTFGNLPAGTYNVTVQNADGCTSVSPNIVINAAQPIPVAATTTVTQPTCAVTSGTITVTDPTGTGLTYSLDGTTFQSAPVFAGLTPGTYNVTVQNAVGCTSTSADIIINAVPAAPAVATTTVSQPTCAVTTGSITVSTPQGTGFTYSIDGTNFQSGTTFAGLAPGSYTITVSNAGCTSVTTPIVINAVPADPIAATATVIQPTCASPTGSITISNPTGSGLTYSIDGTNFQSSITFNNVAAGSYTITVRNSGGCTSQSAAITLNDAGVPAVASVSVTQPTCITTSGTITVDGPFGTGFSYSIDGTNYQVDNVFAGLAPGSYSVTVQNGSGCTSAAVNAVINDVPTAPAMATISTVQPTCNVPSGTINISGPTTAGLTYSINGTDFQEGTSFTNVAPGTYTLVVQNEAGCLSDGVAFTIDALPEFCDIPKGISPNNDGKNDNFDISFLEASRLNIFNRYGKEVYARSNYSNEWFGQSSNGDELPTGTYYYVIEGNRGAKTGWVYINREEN